jgi:hypothetical protein
MHVNIGGDPERDDFDLPAVDIEIPDDARELARDVQAYHRELRARRRHRLARRLRGPLTRGGMVLPLLASCLALTLLAGATLTMFGAGRVLQEPTQEPPTATAAARPAPSAGLARALLPDKTVQVDGSPMPLRKLAPSVLALVPSGCGCAAALRRLSGQAAAAGVPIYLVGASGWMPEVTALATQGGKNDAHVVYDVSDVLGAAYHRAGLTAVLVDADDSVSGVLRNLGPGVQLGGSLRAVASSAAQDATPSGRAT